ncbi:MAG: PhoU domain-containing protein [Clostridia bacterium]
MEYIFENESKLLKNEILKMSEYVTTSMKDLEIAIVKHDLKIARRIVDSGSIIDESENNAHQITLRLFRCDLDEEQTRIASSALKVVSDLQRIADQVSDVAEILLFYPKGPMRSDLSQVIDMLDHALYMVDGSIAAFLNSDLGTAARVMSHDDRVDSLFREIKNRTIDGLFRDRGYADEAIDIIMMIKYIERLADHAVNIGQWTIFAKTGKIEKMK